MRKIINILFFVGFVGVSISAQNSNSSYFLDKWSQRNTLNASFVPAHGQISFPLIGGFNLFSTSNAGVSNFIYPLDSKLVSFMHSSVSGEEFINRLEQNTYINHNLNLNLLNVGLFVNENYLSFGIQLNENLNLNLPVDLFRLLKLGYQQETNRYDLKDLAINQQNVTEYSLGCSRSLNSKLRVGLHINYLVGLSKLDLNYSKFDVLLSDDQFKIDATGELVLMSDIVSFKTDENDNYRFRNLDFDLTSQHPAGHGAAFDVGVEYKPLNKLTLAAAINGIGFIKWKTSSLRKGIAQTNVDFAGFSIDNIDDLSIESQVLQLEEDVKNTIQFKEQSAVPYTVTESTPSSINLSAEYSIWGKENQDITLGLLWNSYYASNFRRNNLMGALTVKPISWFMLSTTYGLISSDIHKLGLAINFCPEWINVFVASDFITAKINSQFLPINKSSVNIMAGISFYLGD